MLKRISSALVPVKNTFDRLTMQSTATKKKPTDFDLVKNEVHFETSNEVVRFLPDILGRALARSWIDKQFMIAFLTDPRGTLARYSVHLPESVEIEVEADGLSRPRVLALLFTTSQGASENGLYFYNSS